MRKVDRKACRDEMGDAAASPMLIFIAMMLFTLLAIIEIDLQRETLRAIGLIIGSEGIDPRFVGP